MTRRLPWIVVLLLTGTMLGSAHSLAGVPDDPFSQEYREPFHRSGKAKENDVRAIAIDSQQQVWIATADGVRRVDERGLTAPRGEAPKGETFDISADPQGDVWVAAWDGLYQITGGQAKKIAGFDVPLSAIAHDGRRLVAAGPDGFWQLRDGKITRLEGAIEHSVQGLLLEDDTLWVATERGLFHRRDDGVIRRYYDESELLSSATSSIALGPRGGLWIGSNLGVDLYQGGRRIRSLTQNQGLPSTEVTALALEPNGTLWVGTTLGVARWNGKQWSLRHSRRWLPDNRVRDIALAKDGAAWIATAGGVSVLRRRKMTLADKAASYENVMRERHVRPPGLMRRCRLRVAGDTSTFEPMDTDNDGLFTGIYLGAESYRYAVTHDPMAKQTAAHAFAAMEFLQHVTETPGFVARSVVPAAWTRVADANRSYTPEEIAAIRVREPRFKPVEVHWHKSRDGRWLWKDDTSSDEISGHYFAYAVYYDLVAQGDEKQRVRDLVRRVTDYIIEGGFTLRDVDGKPTRWGVWSPEKLNHDPDWWPERGTNAIEILSFLNVAWHITGDDKYRRAADTLINEHGYGKHILDPQPHDPGSFTFIDAQLLTLAYRGLLLYEPEGPRRELYLKSLRRWFEIIRFAHSPFYNFAAHVFGGAEDFDREACLAVLRDTPLDLVTWTVDESQREDVQRVKRPQAERWQVNRLLPPSERAVIHWDGNLFAIRDGDGGHSESSASFWLLPYWMGRYHGLIGEAAGAP